MTVDLGCLPAPPVPPPRRRVWPALGMAGHIASFSGALRAAGVPSHARAVLDACRAAALIDLADREQFYWALKANFVTDPSQFAAFDRTFHFFWDEPEPQDPPPPEEPPSQLPSVVASDGAGGDTPVPNPPASGGASAQELLVRKDLRALIPAEEPALAAILRELLAKIVTRPSRRERASFHGRKLEFRRIFRQNAAFGGEIVKLVHREKKLGKRRLAFLGDVSGSMDAYSRFFFLLAFGLARQEPGTELYAFSTRLFRLTDYVRKPWRART
ncbi:MAG: VWA domain-containing protein [Deltaproteobacteria bacterium]|nr:VWA domain-containing protein [Deltaproteobacteria bacterium]